ncbi:hypothetical protein [Streptosporangium sp. CA-115845]|uniref:hypothetical protein n=1 Tax=Streptosporangium sp. CA-115845 TaxID=3240071 RepID=UPI003D8B9212
MSAPLLALAAASPPGRNRRRAGGIVFLPSRRLRGRLAAGQQWLLCLLAGVLGGGRERHLPLIGVPSRSSRIGGRCHVQLAIQPGTGEKVLRDGWDESVGDSELDR